MKNDGTNLITDTLKLAYKFMEEPEFVSINESQIEVVARKIMQAYPKSEIGYPRWIKENLTPLQKDYKLLVYELIAGSVNYQYWCGKSDIRPNGSGATLMYKILDECFECLDFSPHKYTASCEKVVENFIEQIVFHRFPNVENRIKHLKEILNIMKHEPYFIPLVVEEIHKGSLNMKSFLNKIISTYPGYSGDMFLKRLFLLTMMLHQKGNWFVDEIHEIPIPADYQIPKMLRWLGCIEYSSGLIDMIETHTLIPSGSLMECEIRAASIMTCKILSKKTNITMCNIDTYLWGNRKQCNDPFHLTVTTDY